MGFRRGIEVMVEVDRNELYDISRVELWIDDEIIGIGTWSKARQYFIEDWDENRFGLCNLQIKVYDRAENIKISEELLVLYLNFKK